MSGVVVPTTMKSMSFGVSPACAMALSDGFLREIGRGDARIDDVSLANAGALKNPFVDRVDQPLKILDSSEGGAARRSRDR